MYSTCRKTLPDCFWLHSSTANFVHTARQIFVYPVFLVLQESSSSLTCHVQLQPVPTPAPGAPVKHQPRHPPATVCVSVLQITSSLTISWLSFHQCCKQTLQSTVGVLHFGSYDVYYNNATYIYYIHILIRFMFTLQQWKTLQCEYCI